MSRVRSDKFTNRAATGPCTFTDGLTVTDTTGASIGVEIGMGGIVAVAGTFSGDVSVAGTITYEDVQNVDSVGIVTAGKGLRVTTEGIVVTAGVSTLGGGTSMADSVKSYWGTGGDLQIYHDGSNSYINESGTGDLYIRGGTSVRITDLSDNKMFLGQDGGEAQLYYDGLQKLATKTDGAEVSGILTATSLSGRHGNIEAVTKSTGYTLVSGDEGKMIISDSAVTVPQDIFSAGDVITVVNSSGSSFNIIKGTGINLYTIGSSTNATVALAEKGIAIITCFSSNDFIVGGGGVS